MATDINVAFGHSIPFPPTESVAEKMCKGINLLDPRFANDWTLGRGLVCVQSSLNVLFGPHAAIIPTGYRWPRPRQEPDEELISAVSAIARYFQSPRIIILPDDIEPWFYASKWIGEGLTLDDLQQRLAGLKHPSPTFQAAIKQRPDCYEVDGYVIREL